MSWKQVRRTGLVLISFAVITFLSGHSRIARAFNYPADKDVDWSRHSKPFDLVWNVNDEDANGLPWNPLWAYQLDHPGSLPSFLNICGPAFPPGVPVPINPSALVYNGDSMNSAVLARDCTSQRTVLDLKQNWASNFGYCQGLIDGHLEWLVGTHSGNIGWEAWSGDAGFTNLGLSDGDYGLLLHPDGKSSPGFTELNGGAPEGEFGLGLEFNDNETVRRAGGPWWKQFVQAVENPSSNGRSASDMLDTNSGGARGVVTGLIGIDGVHGGYAEYHPVYALALNTAQGGTVDGLRETWTFFLRTQGNGGGCSHNRYSWQSQHGHDYYIQLPWPKAAKTSTDAENGIWTIWPSDVKVVSGLNGQFWAWQPGDTKGWISRNSNKHVTLIKVRFPGDGDYGADGQFTIEYKFAKGAPTQPGPGQWYAGTQPTGVVAERRVRATGKQEKEDDFQIAAITSRIADPAVRARFTADVQNAMKQFPPAPAPKSFPMTFDTTLAEEPLAAGAASRGEASIAVVSPDSSKTQREEAIKNVLDRYKQYISPQPPGRK